MVYSKTTSSATAVKAKTGASPVSLPIMPEASFLPSQPPTILTQADTTDNVGLYIATYASLGQTLSNPTFTYKAEAMIRASLKTPEWNTDMGVIKQGSGPWDKSDDGLGFKSIYVRYLQKAHPWLADQAVKDAIVQYANIQYDSLIWKASDSTENPVNFGRSWNGFEGKGYEGSTVHSQM